jgi:hypothetical protein
MEYCVIGEPFLIRSCEPLSHTFQSSSKARRDAAVSDLASEVIIKHDEFATKLSWLSDRVSQLASTN